MNRFGRLVAPKDGRDFQYLMRSAVAQLPSPRPLRQPYKDGPLLNQGPTSMCVGFASRGFLDGAPIMSGPSEGPTASDIYAGAQQNDEWPGVDYEGTSVRGAMKFLQLAGQITSYVWGQTIQDAIKWMNGGYGSIIVGTNWYAEMSNVDKDGFMLAPPPSLTTPIGGHAWRWNWFNIKKQAILMRNSWGHEFGFVDQTGLPSGYAYLKVPLAQRLLFEDGEIAAATQVEVKPTIA